MPMVNTTAVVVNMGASSSGRTQPPPPSHRCRRHREQARLRLFAPSIAVTSHVLKHRFQIGQPLLGKGETGAQIGPGLDRSGERVDTRRLGAVHVLAVVFLTAREEATRDCASEYRLAAPCQPR